MSVFHVSYNNKQSLIQNGKGNAEQSTKMRELVHEDPLQEKLSEVTNFLYEYKRLTFVAVRKRALEEKRFSELAWKCSFMTFSSLDNKDDISSDIDVTPDFTPGDSYGSLC